MSVQIAVQLHQNKINTDLASQKFLHSNKINTFDEYVRMLIHITYVTNYHTNKQFHILYIRMYPYNRHDTAKFPTVDAPK